MRANALARRREAASLEDDCKRQANGYGAGAPGLARAFHQQGKRSQALVMAGDLTKDRKAPARASAQSKSMSRRESSHPTKKPAEAGKRPLEGGGPASDPLREPRWSSPLSTGRILGLSALLFAAVVAVFWPATGNGFVKLDDNQYVTGNPAVQQGLTWRSVAWAFTSTKAANWHPLTWLSHIVDCQLYGLDPWGHHLTSVLLHALNTVLVFLLFRRMTGAVWRSWLLAAFFGLHPLRAESVAWVAERKDVLSTLFWMLTLWAYAGYADRVKPGPGSGGGSAKRLYLLALLFCALGLMSKPMLVTLPCVMLLFDYWPLARWPAQAAGPLVAEKIPFFGLAAAACVLTFVAQKAGGAMMPGYPMTARVENALVSYGRYLGKLLWPENLAPMYLHPGYWPIGTVLLAGALLAGSTVLVLSLGRTRPYLPVGWLWFLGTLAPVIGLVQVGAQAMADRYTYIPSVGVLLMLVWGAHDLAGRWRGPTRGLLVGGAVALVAVCVPLTVRQIGYWHDTKSLFQRELAVHPDDYVSREAVADALLEEGSTEEAIQQYRAVLQQRPDHAAARINLTVALAKLGRQDEANAQVQQMVGTHPGSAEAHNALATAFVGRGQFDLAAREAGEALRLDPKLTSARDNMGVALTGLGRLEEAVQQFQEAFKLAPDSVSLHNHLGAALSRQGRGEEAIREFQTALQLAPNDPEVRSNLGTALGRAGRLEEAIQQFQGVLKLNPRDAGALNNLGYAYYRLGRLDEASDQIKQALALQPENLQAHSNLGLVLLAQGQSGEGIREFQEVLRLNPRQAAAHCSLAKCLETLGRRDEAAAELREALRLQPDFPEARQLLQTLRPAAEN